jgi:hypothetical protein
MNPQTNLTANATSFVLLEFIPRTNRYRVGALAERISAGGSESVGTDFKSITIVVWSPAGGVHTGPV